MAVRLPVHIADTASLIEAVSHSTAAAKQVFEDSFENLLQSYIGVVPPAVADWALKNYLRRDIIKYAPTATNAVISNFPGPSTPLYLAGARLEASYVMGPVISGQGPNITFMSYLDNMHVGVQACRELMPDLWVLSDCICAAFDQLMAFAHKGFWQPMDTLRDKNSLEALWDSGKAPWKIW
jgi:diacylglycerol O-acyltransferase